MTFEDLCIIVYYPCSAGGKFIVNSLGLSKHCVLHSVKHAQVEISSDSKLISDWKLKTVLATIPENAFDGTWQKYELGVGADWVYIQRNGEITIMPALNEIIKHSKNFCVICHNPTDLKSILDAYPNTRVVKLTNYIQWMLLCKSKTRTEDVSEKQSYWKFVDEQELQQNLVQWSLVDIDDSMMSCERMQTQIEQLYFNFGFDDFDASNWQQYYKKYMQSHNIQTW